MFQELLFKLRQSKYTKRLSPCLSICYENDAVFQPMLLAHHSFYIEFAGRGRIESVNNKH